MCLSFWWIWFNWLYGVNSALHIFDTMKLKFNISCIVWSTLPQLTHWGRDKMAAISQTTLSNVFSWMKMLEIRLQFQWSLFLRAQLTIFQHSDNGLVPTRRKAIICTNDGSITDAYASLSLNELMTCCLQHKALTKWNFTGYAQDVYSWYDTDLLWTTGCPVHSLPGHGIQRCALKWFGTQKQGFWVWAQPMRDITM